ncbi:unnamed protein product [Symbiodinium sp. CCMP2592]|nr:unnamed protein product [Symbiodinium sp. CCMP2592]
MIYAGSQGTVAGGLQSGRYLARLLDDGGVLSVAAHNLASAGRARLPWLSNMLMGLFFRWRLLSLTSLLRISPAALPAPPPASRDWICMLDGVRLRQSVERTSPAVGHRLTIGTVVHQEGPPLFQGGVVRMCVSIGSLRGYCTVDATAAGGPVILRQLTA